MAVQHSLHDDLNLSYSKRENVEAKFSLSRRRRSRRRDYAMMLERGLGGWYGMGWCCWWNWTTSDDDDDDDTRFASRLSSFPCLLAPLIFLYFIISVQLQSASESLPLSLSCFFLSFFEFFLLLLFLRKGIFSCTRGAYCVDSRACFPYAWSVFFLLREGDEGVVLRLGDSSGMMARTTRMAVWPKRCHERRTTVNAA